MALTRFESLLGQVRRAGDVDRLDPPGVEKRQHVRYEFGQAVYLTGVPEGSVLRCDVRDVSNGGVYTTAPTKFGLTIGQRCQVHLALSEASEAMGRCPDLTPPIGARIVRTEPMADPESGSIGVGLRFDIAQQLFTKAEAANCPTNPRTVERGFRTPSRPIIQQGSRLEHDLGERTAMAPERLLPYLIGLGAALLFVLALLFDSGDALLFSGMFAASAAIAETARGLIAKRAHGQWNAPILRRTLGR